MKISFQCWTLLFSLLHFQIKDALTQLINMIASMVEQFNQIIIQLPQEESSIRQPQKRSDLGAHSDRRAKSKTPKKLRIFRLG